MLYSSRTYFSALIATHNVWYLSHLMVETCLFLVPFMFRCHASYNWWWALCRCRWQWRWWSWKGWGRRTGESATTRWPHTVTELYIGMIHKIQKYICQLGWPEAQNCRTRLELIESKYAVPATKDDIRVISGAQVSAYELFVYFQSVLPKQETMQSTNYIAVWQLYSEIKHWLVKTSYTTGNIQSECNFYEQHT